MALFLVQHGLSLPKKNDPEKGLSEKGMEENQRIADVAKHYAIPVKRIVHSGKKRAAQTADVFYKTLVPAGGCEEISGIGPLDDVKPFADRLDNDENILVVGHLPFLNKLLSYLVTGSGDIEVYRFQNSGIVCLDREGDSWQITWTLNPNIG